jgi:hypothetical protein
MIQSATDRTNLIELVTNMRPLWEKKTKTLSQDRSQAEVLEETGEKLNITGKY